VGTCTIVCSSIDLEEIGDGEAMRWMRLSGWLGGRWWELTWAVCGCGVESALAAFGDGETSQCLRPSCCPTRDVRCDVGITINLTLYIRTVSREVNIRSPSRCY
jgi:hypothetical protein